MTKRSHGWGVLALVLLAGYAVSCASGGGVDTTPTLRTSIDAHIGKGLASDSTHVENISDTFSSTETVVAVIDIPTKIEGSLRIRWVLGESESLGEETRALAPGANVYVYRLTPPAGGHRVGEYKFEIYINDNLAETEKFKVM
jgi:hypothetical protein